MNGLTLSENYYHDIVEPALRAQCPEAFPHLAAGLVGEGSECFGFDDAISQDHDFGPRVCIWLSDEAYEAYGSRIAAILDGLPKTYEGFTWQASTPEAKSRSGVLRISDFYKKYTGKPQGPERWTDWIRLPQDFLATCTNGSVFYDGPGEFTGIRQRLLAYYPEDVRIKKIAAKAARMAQAGQYNYPRCLKRHEDVAAYLALGEFLKNTLEIMYLLDKTYMPYYKWAFRGLETMNIAATIRPLLVALVRSGVTAPEENTCRIEDLCSIIRDILEEQQLCRGGDAYLLAHTAEIMSHIQNPAIAALPVMYG